MNKFDMSVFVEKDVPWISWILSIAYRMSFLCYKMFHELCWNVCVYVLYFL